MLALLTVTLLLHLEFRDASHRGAAAQLERGKLLERLEELGKKLETSRKLLAAERTAGAQAAQRVPPARDRGGRPAPDRNAVEEARPDLPAFPAGMDSPDEADDAARGFIARNDARGMLSLWERLLAMGEPGFKQLCGLAADLDLEGLMQTGPYQRSEFRRFLYARSEYLLRFGLFLDSQPSGELPPRVRAIFSLNDEGHDDALQELLGLYDGNDPELLQGYLRKFRRRAEEEVTSGGSIQEGTLTSLALMRTDGSVDALVDLLGRVPVRRPDGLVGPMITREDIVSALAWIGNPRALPALRALREATSDPQQRGLMDAAIERLE